MKLNNVRSVKMKIKELYEEIKKTEIKAWVKFSKGFNMIQLFTGYETDIGIRRVNYRIKEVHGVFFTTVGVDERTILPPTKNPQLILKLVKLLKEIENEK